MTISTEPLRVLLVDSYDSFTYSLASLCQESIPNCRIYVIRNDDFTIEELLPYLKYFSSIIISPGPGSPDNARDIGVVKDLWKVEDDHLLPIFGVCLGLQSLGLEFGGQLKRLNVVKHGQVSQIHHSGVDIFDGVGKVDAVRYHSLHIALKGSNHLEELAWADDGVENGRVLMAVKHRLRPFWAVQYHPESVRTDGGGSEVLQNFWRLADTWARSAGRRPHRWDAVADAAFGPSWPHLYSNSIPQAPSQSTPNVSTSILQLPNLSVPDVCELLGAAEESSPFVLLESAAQPGRFSIVASLTQQSPRITHFAGENYVQISAGKSNIQEDLGSRDVWSWLATFMRARKVQGGTPEVPFWGGLIGYLSYELGVHSLPVPLKKSPPEDKNVDRHPDVNLIFVERSVVIDSSTSKVYVQSVIPGDVNWIAETTSALNDLSCRCRGTSCNHPSVETESFPKAAASIVTLPDQTLYKTRINLAKEYLYAGDSYELCLTAQTRISIPEVASLYPPSSSSSWRRYKALQKTNPAPHSAYLRLHPSTVLSSSPERFLSFSRPPGTVCQLRPIKGTVRKAPGITRAVAEDLLAGSTKEVAENLMIVDLIRHDLHGVVGKDVQVKQFCSVEEYETVWQLVSVIEGRLSKTNASTSNLNSEAELGWEVLRRSLPPGSMTGAPKKRSVEILQTLEENNRGIYSGVLGYWCAGGGGDWSVIIRSCFKYDNHYATGGEAAAEEWTLGAGGAITALSDPQAEWEEMLIKLQSVLKSFGATVPL